MATTSKRVTPRKAAAPKEEVVPAPNPEEVAFEAGIRHAQEARAAEDAAKAAAKVIVDVLTVFDHKGKRHEYRNCVWQITDKGVLVVGRPDEVVVGCHADGKWDRLLCS